jgi:hypothetical protein
MLEDDERGLVSHDQYLDFARYKFRDNIGNYRDKKAEDINPLLDAMGLDSDEHCPP